MCNIIDRHGESCQQETYQQTAALAEVQKRIDKLEEKYFLSEGKCPAKPSRNLAVS
jgi:hypothetical protein